MGSVEIEHPKKAKVRGRRLVKKHSKHQLLQDLIALDGSDIAALIDRLSLVYNGFAYEGMYLTQQPYRMPKEGSGVNYGIALQSSLSSSKLQLAWIEPEDAAGAPVVYYRLQYSPRAATEQVTAFAAHLANSRLIAGDQSVLAGMAEDALSRLFQARSISVRSDRAAEIATCQQQRGNSIVQVGGNCLEPELRYEFKIIGASWKGREKGREREGRRERREGRRVRRWE